MSELSQLAAPFVETQQNGYSYGFLDEFAKREIRRRTLKAIAIPGYLVPYASRELPIARGWGTGGLQVTLSVAGPQSVIKVIDQGADDSVNAANLRRFITRMTGAQTTTDTLQATIIQSRHRIPEEIMRNEQLLVLQVPDPEPLRGVQPDISQSRIMHGDADYSQMWLTLYEQQVFYGRFMLGASYPVVVHGRYLMSSSPIPRWDSPKFHQASHLTVLSAGREKRLYAVPPFTDVRPIEFEDVYFQIEAQAGRRCRQSGVQNKFMNELPQPDGTLLYEVSDTSYAEKMAKSAADQPVTIGKTYFDDQGNFYHKGFLK